MDRWAKLKDFLPSSTQQVKAYLRHMRYKIPRERTTGKESTNEEGLETIIRQRPEDQVLPAILRARHLTKAVSYLDDAIVGRDGRIHPRYTFLPKTGRLSSKRPNLMNLPQGRKGDVMKEVASAIRSSIIPSPGCLLEERDWKAIEALLVGYFAGDDDYMLASKRGIHDIFGSHLLYRRGIISAPRTVHDPDLGEWIEWFKANHPNVRAIAKKRIHGGAYGQGAFNMARDLGVSLQEVRELDEVFATMAPKVEKWKAEVRRRAHSEGLTNPFGASMTFFEVFRKNADGVMVLGKEANEVLAFLPQSTGAFMLREVLVTLDSHPEHGRAFWLLIPTHDSIAYEVLEEAAPMVREIVRATMERSWPELGGLTVETDYTVGRSLANK